MFQLLLSFSVTSRLAIVVFLVTSTFSKEKNAFIPQWETFWKYCKQYSHFLKNDFVLQNILQFISYALHRTDGRAAFALARRIAPSREGLTAAFVLEHVPNHIQKKKQQTQKRENWRAREKKGMRNCNFTSLLEQVAHCHWSALCISTIDTT